MHNKGQQKPIYLDYMSTTPADPRVIEKMQECLGEQGYFGNPSSQHFYGWEAQKKVDHARKQVASLINADASEIIWTSGATEANNLALKGAAEFYSRKGRHIITMATEHRAILEPCHYLSTQNFEITYLKPQTNGLLDIEKLVAAIREDTILVSIMHVNSETGIIQNIPEIAKVIKSRGVIFHVDAAQSMGKIELDVKNMNVDLMSFSAHKIYGPKGIGALYIRKQPRIHLTPLHHGSGQELGLRSGTLPVYEIVGMGEACEIAKSLINTEAQRILKLRNLFWEQIKMIPGVHLNGDLNHQVPHCLNVYFDGIDGESLFVSLKGLALSRGSACNSAQPQPSHVLSAMGVSREKADRSLRFSFGRLTTEQEIMQAVAEIREQVTRLRELSPVWN